MAVEVESRNQLQDFLDVLLRRRWQVLLPAALLLSIGVFLAVIVPKKFVARTQVELRPVAAAGGNKTAQDAPFQIKSLARVRKVAQELQNREYLVLGPDEQTEWLEDLQASVKVRPEQATAQGTSFITIECADVQREWAADFLRALRDDWIEDVLNRDRRKAESELAATREARTRLEEQYRDEERLLTELRREHGLSATQPVPGSDAARTEDQVFERLRQNEAEVLVLEGTIADVDKRIEILERRLADAPPRIEREITISGGTSNDEAIREVEGKIEALRAELEGIRPTHSTYLRVTREIRQLEAELERLERVQTRTESERSSVANPEIALLRKRIDEAQTERDVAVARRDRLLAQNRADRARASELQDVYQEKHERERRIERLSEELAVAEAAYQAKSLAVEQLLSPLSNPFEIIQEVDTPSKPTEPNPWMIVAFSLLFGLGLGLAAALALEFSKSCFRSPSDVARVLPLPVLGSIERIVTRREARLAAARRVAVASCSAVFVGSVLFLTWAWAEDAKYLSPDVRDAIEGLRARLR